MSKKNDEWLRRKVPQPCLRLIDPGAKLKAQIFQDLKLWAPQSTEHLLEVKEDANSTDRQRQPTDSKDFDADRVVGCSPSPTSNINAQERSFRTFNASIESNERILAIESQDSLERLYAKDLLFSFMCSAAKTPGASIEDRAELGATTTSNRAPKILWDKHLEKLADSFRSSSFQSDQEALISIIAPLSMEGILPFPHALLESIRNEVAEEWQLGFGLDALNIYEEFIAQMERYTSGNSGLYKSMLAFLLEVHNDVAYQARSLELGGFQIMLVYEYELKASIENSIENCKVNFEIFCEFERLFKISGRKLNADLSRFSRNDQRAKNYPADDTFDSHHKFTTYDFPHISTSLPHTFLRWKVHPIRSKPAREIFAGELQSITPQ
jgi:hypothetical protein